MRRFFDDQFKFGVATSAYQIEGAANEEGRGPSIWDIFSHTPGKIKDRATGDVACDHYFRYKEDVRLIGDLGVDAYRFSTSWSRVLPTGWGRINHKGLDFYKRLVDALLEKGIEPFLTLYHWDLPQALYEKGGWLNRDTQKAFQEYAVIMADQLGDNVKYWITHNEMWCTAMLGYHQGIFAPGEKNFRNALQVAHSVLVSHGMALRGIRGIRSDLKLGIAPNYLPSYPQDPDSPEDVQAAANYDGYFNRWFLDPLAGRGYPEDMLELYKDNRPVVEPGEMDLIAQDLDFIGLNCYNSNWYTADPSNTLLHNRKVPQPQLKQTADRDVYPEGLYDAVKRFSDDYGFTNIFITENGAAFNDRLIEEGRGLRVRDPERVDFLKEHFGQAARAVKDGFPLRGFFVWSLMDNFEWAAGYSLRYGLYYVDYGTQKRIPKDSARWLRDFIKGNMHATR